MKKYHVYGIGNALVDVEFEVDTNFLQKMNIEKGLMTLVDENRQSELVNNLEGVKHKRSCGGSAANTIIAVSQLGGKSFYSCKVASDETGDFYYNDLKSHGVETNLGDSRPEGITGKCLVLITPDADRTMNSFLGITSTFSKEELVKEEIKESEYLYMEGYLATSEKGIEAAIEAAKCARNNGVKTSLTFSDPGVVSYFRDGFKKMIGEGLDLIFCNEAEALSFTETENIFDAVESLKKYANGFAITRGPKGALAFDGEHLHEIEAPEVKAVDTNGAGDLFAGSFLYAITHGHDFAKAGKLACHASSKLVTSFGARLQNEQILDVKSQILS